MGTTDYSTKKWGQIDETPEPTMADDSEIVVDVPEDWFNEDAPPTSGMSMNFQDQKKFNLWHWLRIRFNF